MKLTRDKIQKKYPTVKDMLAEIIQAAEGITNAPATEAAEREQIIVTLAMEVTAILNPELAGEF